MLRVSSWLPPAAAVIVYAGLTAFMGRDVLAHLASTVAPDEGDPVFTATLMYWNATHVPFTAAWWQLPIFYPTRDALAFSEHLLGLSVLSTPLYWLTRDPIVTQNVTMLLTFPLCALAMYALVRRLTGSAAAAFLAGLAFGFAPYRVAQLSHVHVLAAFWTPLALLGLHAYLDTRRRRWLALYAVAWLLQVMSNAYMLVLLSMVVGLWVLWFVVARRRWRDLAAIAVASAVAFVPVVPIVMTYLTVHEGHGFTRTLGEMREFSADLLSVVCAPGRLTFWSWLQVNCRPEGDLFPGLAVAAAGMLAVRYVLAMRDPDAPGQKTFRGWRGRGVMFARAGLLVVAAVYAGIIVSVLSFGPWRLEAGPLSASVTTLEKPVLIAVAALAGWLVLAPGVYAAARRSSTIGFYVVAALVTWALALGPTIIVMGRPIAVDGPFAALMALPGVDGLRVPARFWLMTMTCLVVASALAGRIALGGRSRRFAAVAVAIAAMVVLGDGWTRIPVAPAPRAAPAPHLLAGATVIELATGNYGQIAAGYRAVTGGWRTVNGYSGYLPNYYPALRDTFRAEEDTGLAHFQRAGPLHVIVPRDATRLVALVERQPGAVLAARNAWAAQYRLPQRAGDPPAVRGVRVPISSVDSPCSPAQAPLAHDGDDHTRWQCPGDGRQVVTVDLGRVARVGLVVHRVGPYFTDFPSRLEIETSEDGAAWGEARRGSVLGEVIAGGFADPRSLFAALPFEPRNARFIRLRHRSFEAGISWTIAELEVWSGPPAYSSSLFSPAAR